jgi:acetyltransferase-like isoleucine patch superfamily enzyme
MNSSGEERRKEPAMTPQQAKLSNPTLQGIGLYRSLAVGEGTSLTHFLFYEAVTTLFSNLPGVLGFGARALTYPALFQRVAGRIGFGRGVVLRVPSQIAVGQGVLVDDYATLDVRGREGAISLGDRSVLGRYSTVAAKGGVIEIAAGANIGSYCRIATNSKVVIGESVLIGAYCYVGPGNHQRSEPGQTLIASAMELKGGVTIGAHCWLGAGVTVLDGVTIGERAIIGAHSVVMHDIPSDAVAVGAPAKVIRINSPQD